MILVTGATGQLGTVVVESLLARTPEQPIGVSVRNPDKAWALKARGVKVRRGDFNDRASLDTAFESVGRLLIISTDGNNGTRIRQHRTAVAAAEAADIGFIAYTSIARADTTTLSLGEVHCATEEAIRRTGIPFCFLRNNWYAENEIPAVQAVAAGAPVATSAGEGRIGWAARHDYAEAAAAVLTTQGHDNAIYELSGPPRTYRELTEILSRVLQREVSVQQVDHADYESILSAAGLPGDICSFLAGVQASVRRGDLDVDSEHLATLLGRSPTPLSVVLTQMVGESAAAPGSEANQTSLHDA